MTRIFITGTIVARGEVGIKDSMAFVPPGPPVPELADFIPLGAPVPDIVLEPPVPDIILGPPVPDIVLGGPVQDIVPLAVPVLDIILRGVLALAVMALEPSRHIVLKPPLPAVVSLGRLRKKSIHRSSPTGASSQIALPGAIWDHFESEIEEVPLI